jgi:hypothetical protein
MSISKRSRCSLVVKHDIGNIETVGPIPTNGSRQREENSFLNALRRRLENKEGNPTIIFLIDEQFADKAWSDRLHFKNYFPWLPK